MTDFPGLFLQAFLTGMGYAVLLSVLGCYLRLRDEWLAAFAYSHVAAAGALCALAAGVPLLSGGLGLAALAALLKHLLAERLRLAGGTAYALLLLLGWAVSVLLTSNLPMAERLGHALFDGQLYFADASQLALAGASLAVALPLLALLSRRLLLARVYPDFFGARRLPAWQVHLGFDLLTVAVLAAATMSLGVMASFAMVFVPSWLAFLYGNGWRRGIMLSSCFGAAAYMLAFYLALRLDQPFGPTLAMVLGGAGMLALPFKRHCA